MIWGEPTDHLNNCHFRMVPPTVKVMSKKKKKCTLECPNIHSAIRSVPYGHDLPVPKVPESLSAACIDEEEGTVSPEPSTSSDPDFEQTTSTKPHLLTESELNDLVRDLNLPKNEAELLGSDCNSGISWQKMPEYMCIGTIRSRLLHSLSKRMTSLCATTFLV